MSSMATTSIGGLNCRKRQQRHLAGLNTEGSNPGEVEPSVLSPTLADSAGETEFKVQQPLSIALATPLLLTMKQINLEI